MDEGRGIDNSVGFGMEISMKMAWKTAEKEGFVYSMDRGK